MTKEAVLFVPDVLTRNRRAAFRTGTRLRTITSPLRPYSSCFEGGAVAIYQLPSASLQRVRPKLPFHTPICLCPGKFIGGPLASFFFHVHRLIVRRPLRFYRNRRSLFLRLPDCSTRTARIARGEGCACKVLYAQTGNADHSYSS